MQRMAPHDHGLAPGARLDSEAVPTALGEVRVERSRARIAGVRIYDACAVLSHDSISFRLMSFRPFTDFRSVPMSA